MAAELEGGIVHKVAISRRWFWEKGKASPNDVPDIAVDHITNMTLHTNGGCRRKTLLHHLTTWYCSGVGREGAAETSAVSGLRNWQRELTGVPPQSSSFFRDNWKQSDIYWEDKKYSFFRFPMIAISYDSVGFSYCTKHSRSIVICYPAVCLGHEANSAPSNQFRRSVQFSEPRGVSHFCTLSYRIKPSNLGDATPPESLPGQAVQLAVNELAETRTGVHNPQQMSVVSASDDRQLACTYPSVSKADLGKS